MVVIVLVLARSAVFLFWEQVFFDSDQAVVGLMAKHLSELKAFPVYFYGQQYLLGVEAWLAAPIFAVLSPSVISLKSPLAVINVVVALLLIALLVHESRLRPMGALLASLFFVLPPPGTAMHFMANGASVEPFLYVLSIWFVRDRPLLLGIVTGIGFLHREFTIYGLTALLALQVADRTLFRGNVLVQTALAVVAAGFVIAVIDVLKQFSNPSGPGTSFEEFGRAFMPSSNLAEVWSRVCFQWTMIPTALSNLVRLHWAWLFGLYVEPVSGFGVNATMLQGLRGTWWFLPALAGFAGARLVRLCWHFRCLPWKPPLRFPTFLVLVGLQSALAYAFGRCGFLDLARMRYDLLSVLLPVGLVAAFFSIERARWALRAVGVLVCAWALVSGLGHTRLLGEYWLDAPPSKYRAIATALESRGVRYAWADYWTAYHVTFLANERVVIATPEYPRIWTYNLLVQAHAQEAVRLSTQPCTGGVPVVEGVFLCK